MLPKKVTVLKVTGVDLVTLFILILAVTQHIHSTGTIFVTEFIFSEAKIVTDSMVSKILIFVNLL